MLSIVQLEGGMQTECMKSKSSCVKSIRVDSDLGIEIRLQSIWALLQRAGLELS